MKKISAGLFAVSFFFLISCTASRAVKNNTFVSVSPKLAITVAQEFEYVNNIKQVEYHKSLRGDRKLKIETDSYYFFAIDPKENQISRSVVLGVSESEGTYAGDLFTPDKDLEHGMAGLSGENYEFSTRLASFVMPKQIAVSLKETGYMLPECILVKQYKKIELDNRKQMRFIHYWEDALNSGYSCNAWRDKALLVEGQKAYLQGFNKRASEAFKVGQADK